MPSSLMSKVRSPLCCLSIVTPPSNDLNGYLIWCSASSGPAEALKPFMSAPKPIP